MSHIFLVALEIEGSVDRETAETWLHEALPEPGSPPTGSHVECWWVAEDDRRDGSDNDSAVFVNPGMQMQAYRLLRLNRMTPVNNDPYYGRREVSP